MVGQRVLTQVGGNLDDASVVVGTEDNYSLGRTYESEHRPDG